MEAGDGITVVATKLAVPTVPSRLASRPGLLALLDEAVTDDATRVVLVSAPAGSGKSTLVADWQQYRADCAWLQADAADGDPARFWGHMIAALESVVPGVKAATVSAIPGSGSDATPVIDRLANELAGASPTVLVVDDYHLIANPVVDEAMERLIELAPSTFTLILCTRLDPGVRLARLRVRGQLAEVRADDLRFDPEEASVLLTQQGGAPSSQQVEALCERTEGWAAGLVLAGLSLAASDDGDAFVASFQGDDRLVVEYLTDEFLAGVADDDRMRLLQTSVLDRMNGPLIDAVCATTDGTPWLQHTAATNQLVIGLDRTGTWYRYHHLLADLLRLEAERTIDLAVIHGRAAAWHQREGDSHAAVEHYIAAGEFNAAADLIYDDATELMNRGQLRTVRHQINRLGPVADEHAGAMVVRGWISLLTGNFTDAQASVERARALDPNDNEAGLLVALAIMTHIAAGNIAAALDAARSAGDPFESTQAMTLGGAHTWGGAFDAARPLLERANEMAPQEGNAFVEAVTPIFSALGHLEAGDARAARRYATQALEVAAANGFDDLAQIALAHSIVARTTDDPAEAVASAERGVELARRSPEYVMFAYALASAGDVLCHHGDPPGAQYLAEARAIVDRCPDPGIAGRYLARVEARHQLATPPTEAAGLVEDLTDRELAVLRYLPAPMSQREIASELYVSLNTVKTHCKAIYRKLGVGDRKAAVQAARDINLL
ncbi:MAG: hypothetical protein GY929_01830 [Actinomycetia bacterium]|nr:hypothetical protein [Actinomycetes bacterium]